MGSASGGLVRSTIGTKGNVFGFGVTAAEATTMNLVLRVAAGAPGNQNLDELLKITWNGVEIKTGCVCEDPTQANVGWHAFEDAVVNGLTLKEGHNQLVIEVVGNGAPNIDYFLFQVNPEAAHACESVCSVCGGCTDKECTEEVCATKCDCGKVYASILTIENAEANTYRIEAEASGGVDYSECASNIRDEDVSSASGGKVRSTVGTQGNVFGFGVTAKEGATIKLVIRVAAGAPGDQNLDELLKITWNGEEIKTGCVCEDPTQANVGWHAFEDAIVNGLTLKEGHNQLVIEVIGGGAPNIDYFEIIVA